MKTNKIVSNTHRPIEQLVTIMSRLRDPQKGCPWDVEQDFKSIAPYTLEEAYEVVDAIEKNDMPALKDELGDLLLQVVFHAQMAEEAGLFTFDDVAKFVTDKMISRHPHVFGDAHVTTAEGVLTQWEDLKALEKKDKLPQNSILDDVPVAHTALVRAQKIQKKAAKVGFDWPDTAPIFDKIEEEINELKQAVVDKSSSEIEEELGDILFAVVNLGRKLGVDSETALRQCNNKFYKRFNGIENQVKLENKDFSDYTLEELEKIWQDQKRKA